MGNSSQPDPAAAPAKPSPGHMLDNIQALRFFAAFAVVLYHSRKLFNELGCQGDVFLQWAQFGSAGVDVFFVISGYVMWHTTSHSPRTPVAAADFLRRRLFRIYLGYWPYYFLAAAVTLLLGQRDLDNIYWVDSFLLFNSTIRHQVLGVAWTLSYELYFYILFAPMILLAREHHRRLLLGIFVFLVALNIQVKTHSLPYGFFVSSFLIEFFAGCLLSAYLGANRSRILLLLCAVMVVVFVNHGVGLSRMHMNRIQGFGVAAIFLVLVAVLLENTRWYIASRFWVLLGNCSYSLYLGHFVLLWIYLYVFRQTGLEPGMLAAYLIHISYLAVAIGFSVLAYRFIEAPLYKYALSNWFGGLRR
jgi:exopolysaccharide production protein ExoZ